MFLIRWVKELYRRRRERQTYREIAKAHVLLQQFMQKMQPWDRQRMRNLIEQHKRELADSKCGADVVVSCERFRQQVCVLLTEAFGPVR